MLPPEDIADLLRSRLQTNWDKTNTPLGSNPHFSTGWYDFGSGGQQVTVTNPESSAVRGGDTGITSSGGDGKASQLKAGTVLVNAWAGDRNDCEGVGPNGEDRNPKQVCYKMAVEACRVVAQIDAKQTAFLSIYPDDDRRLPPDDDGVYRYEVTVRFTFFGKAA